MMRANLSALVVGADPLADAVVAALEGCGVRVRRLPLADATAADAEERADLVVVAAPDLPARAAGIERFQGRLWLLATGLPAPLELLVAPPEVVTAAASAARWVVSPDETTRGLLEVGVQETAKRSVVLPVAAGSEVLLVAVRALLDRTFPRHDGLEGRARPLRVVVAGHALHFLEAVLEDWRGNPGIELRVDEVPSFARHDEAASRALIEWADVAVCEWASPVAAFYSRNKRDGQRLVVRLHRAELYSEWWQAIEAGAVDQVVCVSGHYATLTRRITGWAPHKVVVIPNYVDSAVLDRPKLPGAEFAVGFMGAVPRRKRLDLALDVVALLRERDPRFTLYVKTRPAWDVPYAWRDEAERDAFAAVLRRVRTDARLVDGVVFDAYGSDVGTWLRRVGWMLSTSDDESFHLAPAETMASGGVPVLRDWPGVDTIYDRRWVHGEPAMMAGFIAGAVEQGRWAEFTGDARSQALASFDVSVVTDRFARILTEDLEAYAAL